MPAGVHPHWEFVSVTGNLRRCRLLNRQLKSTQTTAAAVAAAEKTAQREPRTETAPREESGLVVKSDREIWI